MSEIKNPRWGNWVFDCKEWRLIFDPTDYVVELRNLETSAKALDCICQVAHKVWITPEELGNLVQAFDDLLVPQALLCGYGKERGPISAEDIEQTVKTSLRLLEGGQQ